MSYDVQFLDSTKCYTFLLILANFNKSLQIFISAQPGLRVDGESCGRAEGKGGGQERERGAVAELQVAGIRGAHNGRLR